MKSICRAAARRAAPALILLAAGCGPNAAPPPEPVRPVHALQLGAPVRDRPRTFSGTLRPAVEADISFRVAGKILELPIKPGAAVREGDLLARLDLSDFELQVKQAEAQDSQARALLKQARAEYDRMRALYESRTASKSELDQAQASFESAEAQQAVAQKTLELARLQMEYGSLAAPFDGLVIARPVDIHQTVSAGQPVATLAANGMDMVIGLPETLVTQVRLGDPAEVTVGAAPGRLFRAAVSEIAASTGGRSTYPVRLTLQDDPGPLRSGMTGEAVLTFAAADGGVFHVPAGSVVSRPDGTRFLWIVDPGRLIVEERTVVPGALTSAGLEIREGVRAGEWVAVRGVHRLSPGTRVRILESEP